MMGREGQGKKKAQEMIAVTEEEETGDLLVFFFYLDSIDFLWIFPISRGEIFIS